MCKHAGGPGQALQNISKGGCVVELPNAHCGIHRGGLHSTLSLKGLQASIFRGRAPALGQQAAHLAHTCPRGLAQSGQAQFAEAPAGACTSLKPAGLPLNALAGTGQASLRTE